MGVVSIKATTVHMYHVWYTAVPTRQRCLQRGSLSLPFGTYHGTYVPWYVRKRVPELVRNNWYVRTVRTIMVRTYTYHGSVQLSQKRLVPYHGTFHGTSVQIKLY